MTEAEALEILKQRNIHRGFFESDKLFLRNGDEVLKGELVGELSNGYIRIAEYIPSMIGKTYFTIPSRRLKLSSPDAEEVLIRYLDLLEDTVNRYDEESRRKRVNAIHQYFAKRNLKIKIVPSDTDILDEEPLESGTLYFR